MNDIAGWPSGGRPWAAEEVAGALAGMVVRDSAGTVRGGVLTPGGALLAKRSDMNVTVDPVLVVRAEGRAALVGGTNEPSLVAISPAPSANSRIDLIYARPQNVSAGDPPGSIFVVDGVPGAAPSKPALPPGGVELGTVQVPAGATSTNACTVTVTAAYTCMAGGILRFRSIAERDGFAGVEGQHAVIGTDVFVRSGGAWKSILPASPRAGTLSVPTGTLTQIGSTGIYGRTFVIEVPAVTRAGEVLDLKVRGVGSGYGVLSPVTLAVEGTKTKVTVRFSQPGSAAGQTLSLMWQMITLGNT